MLDLILSVILAVLLIVIALGLLWLIFLQIRDYYKLEKTKKQLLKDLEDLFKESLLKSNKKKK